MKTLSLARIIKEQRQEDLIDVVENCLTEIDQEEQATDQDWKIMGRDNSNQTLKNLHDRTNRLLDPYGAFILAAKAGLQAKLLQKDQIMQPINILKKLRTTISDAASMPGRKDAKESYMEMKIALRSIKIVLSKTLGGREAPKYQSPFENIPRSTSKRPERQISAEESVQRKKDARKFEELKNLLNKAKAMQAERQSKKNSSDDLERRIRDKKKQGLN